MNPLAENPGTPARIVRLIDARVSVLTPIEARLYRDLPASWLDDIERQWAAARERAVGTGSAPIEHAHWNWRNKTDSVNSGRHRIVAVEYEGDIQGVMALARRARRRCPPIARSSMWTSWKRRPGT